MGLLAGEPDYRAMLKRAVEMLSVEPKCNHAGVIRSEEDGIVYYDCPDCGNSMAVHPDQERAWAKL